MPLIQIPPPLLWRVYGADVPAKGQSCFITYYAWNTNTTTFRSGDSANHTLRLVKDGTAAAPTNAAAAVDNTNTPGLYQVALTTAETQFNTVVIGGISTTASTVIFGTTISFSNLPVFNPGTNQGLLTLGSGVGQLSANSGFGLVSVQQWEGLPPAPLINALVQTAQSGQPSSQTNVNVTNWQGSSPASLITGLVQTAQSGQFSSLPSVNTTQIGGTTTSTSAALIGVNVVTWSGGTVWTSQSGTPITAHSGITNANILQWVGTAPAPLTAALLVQTAQSGQFSSLPSVNTTQIGGTATSTSAALLGVNVSTWSGGTVWTNISGTPVTAVSGLPAVNLTQWEGVAPAPLLAGLVQSAQSGQASSLPNVNLTQWEGVAPAPLSATFVQTLQSGQFSSLPNVNLTQWEGTAPAPLVNALVQTTQSGALSGGVNVTQIGGVSTSTSAALIGVNLVTWEGGTPAPLINALVQTTQSGALSGGVNVTQFGGTTVTGRDIGASVIVGTNNDKTGYTLTQSFPANFATLVINASGAVTIDGSSPLTESYAALHVPPNLQQILFETRGLQAEKSVVGTVLTMKKIDGATTAESFTLNDPTNPTSITRTG